MTEGDAVIKGSLNISSDTSKFKIPAPPTYALRIEGVVGIKYDGTVEVLSTGGDKEAAERFWGFVREAAKQFPIPG